MTDELCYNCKAEDEILREQNANISAIQENVSKSPPPAQEKKTYHIGQRCKHRVVSHKHRYNVVHTHRSLASKGSSTHTQNYEASVTSRTNLQSCPSQAFNSTGQIEQIDLTQPCQQHIHKPMQQRRMERIDLTQQRQQRIDQVERNLPYQQQVYHRNFRPNESLRFGHLGEKNALCSMCVCRWANKRLY